MPSILKCQDSAYTFRLALATESYHVQTRLRNRIAKIYEEMVKVNIGKIYKLALNMQEWLTNTMIDTTNWFLVSNFIISNHSMKKY